MVPTAPLGSGMPDGRLESVVWTVSREVLMSAGVGSAKTEGERMLLVRESERRMRAA